MRLSATITAFWKDKQASTATVLALMAPVVLGATALAVDTVDWMKDKSNLQAVADAAALAAAREMSINQVDPGRADSIAKAVTAAHRVAAGAQVATELTNEQRTVTVTLRRAGKRYLSGLIGVETPLIRVSSTASNVGERICVIALGGHTLPGTQLPNVGLNMEARGRLTARGCSVYSNVVGKISILAQGDSLISTRLTCSAGGYTGADRNFQPRPITDCPPVQDPLAQRPMPPSDPCPAVALPILTIETTRTLAPGTYCGGVAVMRGARLNLEPGIYVFKNGPLIVTDTSQLRGAYVSLVFSGPNATLQLGPDTTIDLGAPRSGAMAGVLFFEDSKSPANQVHRIQSNNAYNLLGTIYLPRGQLLADGDRAIADRSPWTAIIASRISIVRSADIVLNDRYSDTDVPVPVGIGPVASRLVR